MKISKIIDSEYKTGVSAKNGKPWTLVKVEFEDGTTGTGFGPVSEGDDVEVERSQYGLQFKAPRKAASTAPMNDDVLKMLISQNKAILERLDTIMAVVTDSSAKKVFAAPPGFVPDEEIDPESIPF